MDRSPEHVEQKKPGTKGYLLYYSSCIKFKDGQNQTMVIEVRRMATSLCCLCVSRKVVLIQIKGLSGMIEKFFCIICVVDL